MRLRSTTLALCLAAAPLTAQIQWVTSPINGHRYALTAPMTWKQAEASAIGQGGHLATVRNQTEHNWLVKTFGAGAPQSGIWIGCTDELTEGTWLWASAEPAVFSAFMTSAGEPNGAQVENYGCLWHAHGGRWNDAPGTQLMPAITEYIPLASYTTYRQACAGSLGTPQLNASLPLIGKPWTLTVTQLKPNSMGSLFFALDDKFLGTSVLPLDLGFLGASGCFVNVNTVARAGTITIPLPANGLGVAQATVAMPTNPAVLGFEFFNQYASLDAPPGRGLPLTTTNAGKGVVGR